MTAITSRVLKTDLIDWRKAQWLQNENLKDLDSESMDKLKNSLKANNFVMPFNLWEEHEDARWILDGHHRQKALKSLEEDGIAVPDKLPATFIHCNDKQEAAKLVLIYSSIYAKISQQGLSDFLELHEIELEELTDEIDIPDFSMHRFERIRVTNPILHKSSYHNIFAE